jgi:hypothetical protein
MLHPINRYTAGCERLPVGQTIKLKGTLNTEQYPPILYLLDCKILTTGPDPAIPITAANLAKAYADDDAEAKKRFEGKQLLVQGVVKDVILKGTDKLPNPVVILEGAAGKTGKTLCVWSDSHYARREDFEKLKKGQQVTIKGTCFSVSGKDLIGEEGVLVSRVVIVR